MSVIMVSRDGPTDWLQACDSRFPPKAPGTTTIRPLHPVTPALCSTSPKTRDCSTTPETNNYKYNGGSAAAYAKGYMDKEAPKKGSPSALHEHLRIQKQRHEQHDEHPPSPE